MSKQDNKEKEICPECGKPIDECICKGKGEIKSEEKEICPECGKPIEECICGKDKKDKYDLNEIPEYMELKTQFEVLNSDYNGLKEEVEALREFKVSAERKNKNEMIDSFYMLSDEDKKDVIENIDKYSLSEIESKLSVICFRNKVSFDGTSHKEAGPQVTYSLQDDGMQDDVPGWIKAMRSVANNQ